MCVRAYMFPNVAFEHVCVCVCVKVREMGVFYCPVSSCLHTEGAARLMDDSAHVLLAKKTSTHTPNTPKAHKHRVNQNVTFSQKVQLKKCMQPQINTHAQSHTLFYTHTHSAGLQTKCIFFGGVTVVFTVGLLSHGIVQRGIQCSMIMMGEGSMGVRPSPHAPLQNWNKAKCQKRDSSN